MSDQSTFEQELETILNRYSMENGSNTPDFILAQYLHGCLMSFNIAVTLREKWYGRGAEECRVLAEYQPPKGPSDE